MVARFTAFNPAAEVLGQAMVAFVECSNRDAIRPFMEAHGLTEVNPDQWYPQQVWLDVLSDIANAKEDAMIDFVSIGMKLIRLIQLPPEFEQMSFRQVLQVWDEAGYQSTNRGEDAGYLAIDFLSDTHVKMALHTPYPDDLMYGACFALARRFLPHDTEVSVYFDESTPRRADVGGDTVIHIEWAG
ncbi:MAG: hypothetical protein GYB65_19850 [Chloroflexi bacterium]|nr:hypothetical protein [Chloroflexota bacterium]